MIRTFEGSVSLNSQEAFGDVDKTLLLKLRENYNSSCYSGAYVANVTEVVQRSACRVDENIGAGMFNVDVRFKAECIVYKKGDIIIATVLNNNNDAGLICTTDYAAVMIPSHKILRPIKEGWFLPAVVRDSVYSFGKEEITISATPFNYASRLIIYEILDDEIGENQLILEAMSQQYQAVLEQVNKLDKAAKKQYDVFAQLLYPFKKKQGKLPKCKPIKLLDSAKEFKPPSGSYVFYHPSEPLEDGVVQVIDKSHFTGKSMKSPPIKDVYSRVLIKFMEDAIDYIKFLLEFSDIMKDKMVSHKYLISMYQKMKR